MFAERQVRNPDNFTFWLTVVVGFYKLGFVFIMNVGSYSKKKKDLLSLMILLQTQPPGLLRTEAW